MSPDINNFQPVSDYLKNLFLVHHIGVLLADCKLKNKLLLDNSITIADLKSDNDDLVEMYNNLYDNNYTVGELREQLTIANKRIRKLSKRSTEEDKAMIKHLNSTIGGQIRKVESLKAIISKMKG